MSAARALFLSFSRMLARIRETCLYRVFNQLANLFRPAQNFSNGKHEDGFACILQDLVGVGTPHDEPLVFEIKVITLEVREFELDMVNNVLGSESGFWIYNDNQEVFRLCGEANSLHSDGCILFRYWFVPFRYVPVQLVRPAHLRVSLETCSTNEKPRRNRVVQRFVCNLQYVIYIFSVHWQADPRFY